MRILKNLFLILLSVILTIIVLEGFLRIVLKERSSSLNIGILNKKFSKKYYSINSVGMRDEEIKLKSKNDNYIMFIGDSITFGSGLKKEDIYPQIVLENQNKYNIFNFSLPGANTIYQLNLLKNNLEKFNEYKFDYLVYQYLGNDIDYSEHKNYNIEAAKLGDNKYEVFLIDKMKKFYLVDYLYTPFLGKKFGKKYNKNLISIYDDEEKVKVHFKDINEIFKTAHSNNINVIFVPFPFVNNRNIFNYSDIYVSKLFAFFKSNCKADDVFINVPIIINEIDENLWKVNKNDAHPSADIHLSVGKAILNILKKDKSELFVYCK